MQRMHQALFTTHALHNVANGHLHRLSPVFDNDDLSGAPFAKRTAEHGSLAISNRLFNGDAEACIVVLPWKLSFSRALIFISPMFLIARLLLHSLGP